MNTTGVVGWRGTLFAKHFYASGRVDDLGVIADYKLVTNKGADDTAKAFNGAFTLANFNFHDCGTGTTAPAVTDTALQTPAGTARATGTQSNPATQQYQTVGTISFTSTLAITEWGLFSASTVGDMFDRATFTAINVVSGDSIQFTFLLTVNSGG